MLDISYQANAFHISYQGKPVGSIHTYSNPYHQTNIYLRLDLVDFDCTIAEQLFQSLQTSLGGKPLQVMLSSAEQERIHFLTAAGFVCKRKCYEFEVTKQDYLGQTGTTNLITARKGTAPYQIACQQILTTIKQSTKTSILGLPVKKNLKRAYLIWFIQTQKTGPS